MCMLPLLALGILLTGFQSRLFVMPGPSRDEDIHLYLGVRNTLVCAVCQSRWVWGMFLGS